jgi:hypoxanthine phosphoribosyltransferase
MDFQDFVNIFGVLGTIVTIFSFLFILQELYISRKLKAISHSSIPMRVSRSISYKQYISALNRLKSVFDEMRFVPDYIVGVHYGGLSVAAQIGKLNYTPILHAKVLYKNSGNGRNHIVDKIDFNFDISLIKDKNVLLVDNSVDTGNTLKQIHEELQKHAGSVTTFVLYRKRVGINSAIVPDIVLFESKSPLNELIR